MSSTQRAKRGLTSRLREMAAFDQPEEGSAFHDKIINLSTAHTLRDEPAWMYSIEDAERGAALENARLRPLVEALIECVTALEQMRPHYGNDTIARDQALARLEEIAGEK